MTTHEGAVLIDHDAPPPSPAVLRPLTHLRHTGAGTQGRLPEVGLVREAAASTRDDTILIDLDAPPPSPAVLRIGTHPPEEGARRIVRRAGCRGAALTDGADENVRLSDANVVPEAAA